MTIRQKHIELIADALGQSPIEIEPNSIDALIDAIEEDDANRKAVFWMKDGIKSGQRARIVTKLKAEIARRKPSEV